MKTRLLLLALCCASSALAQPSPAPSAGNVSYPISTIRNVSTLGAGNVAPGNVGRYAFAVATNGLVVADAPSTVPLGGGRNLPVLVRSNIPKASAAAAIGRFALKTLPVLSAGVALYDLGNELGFGLDNSSGTLEVTRTDSNAIPSSGTYFRTQSGSQYYGWSEAEVCRNWGSGQGYPGAVPVPFESRCTSSVGFGVTIGPTTPPYSCPAGWYSNGTSCATTPPSSPGTVQQLEDAINARSSWPPSSAMARAMRDAINSGEIVPVHPEDVSGPATTPGPVTTTTDAVNNTTTTSTTTNHHTYNGPNVTTTTTTTTVTVDNTTNNIISSTTTTAQPVLPDSQTDTEEDNTPATDTPLPSITKLYEPQFPDGLEGVWNDRKAQLLDTSLFQIIPALMPNVGDGGCPQWSIPSIYGGTLNASVPCNVWYFIRLVIIISALLLARRLIFGG
jgi:hypothetical protein